MNNDEIVRELLELLSRKDDTIDKQGNLIRDLTIENIRLCNIIKECSKFPN